MLFKEITSRGLKGMQTATSYVVVEKKKCTFMSAVSGMVPETSPVRSMEWTMVELNVWHLYGSVLLDILKLGISMSILLAIYRILIITEQEGSTSSDNSNTFTMQ
jgi:hypothetical protein